MLATLSKFKRELYNQELEQLLRYATPRQSEAISAVIEHGSHRKAAEALGIATRNIAGLLERARVEAARSGYAPDFNMTEEAPPGFNVKGVTELHHAEKGLLMKYVMKRQNAEQQEELIKAAVESWIREAAGIEKPIPAPDLNSAYENLMTFYPMGDPHFGMYSWAAETGADFNLEIAERDLLAAVEHLVRQSPPTPRAALINLGDFFHYDSMEAVTPRSGHILDADTRPQEMIDVGVRALRRAVKLMLEKHQVVEVYNVPGNHDPILSRAMNTLFNAVYENEPRVVACTSPASRFYIEHGKCLIGLVHGEKTKDSDLPGIMATERPEAWGRTKFRAFWRGHHHQDRRQEFNGCMVEQFRTLAAGDAYAAGAGYLSGRDMKAIVMHADFGEISRFTCGIDLLRSAQNKSSPFS